LAYNNWLAANARNIELGLAPMTPPVKPTGFDARHPNASTAFSFTVATLATMPGGQAAGYIPGSNVANFTGGVIEGVAPTGTGSVTPPGPGGGAVPGPQVNGVATSLRFVNKTTGNTSLLAVGDQWEITITGPAGAHVYGSATKNGTSLGTQDRGVITASGILVLNGTITTADLGSNGTNAVWNETWSVGSSQSTATVVGSFSFTTTATRPTTTQSVSITLSSQTLTIGGATPGSVSATVTTNGVVNRRVTVTSSNSLIVPSVDANGLITVRSNLVNPPPGQVAVLTVHPTDMGADTSKDLRITVVQAGQIPGGGGPGSFSEGGSSTPTLHLSGGGLTASNTLSIRQGQTVVVNGAVLVHDTVQFALTATSSNTGKATVSVNTNTGAISIVGVSPGTATITVHPTGAGASTAQDKIITVTITALATTSATPVALTLSNSTLSMIPGQNNTVIAQVIAQTGVDAALTATSSNSAVATVVSAPGRNIIITAIAPGTAIITVHPVGMGSDTSQDKTVIVTVVAPGTDSGTGGTGGTGSGGSGSGSGSGNLGTENQNAQDNEQISELQRRVAELQTQISGLIQQLGSGNSGSNQALINQITTLTGQNTLLQNQIQQLLTSRNQNLNVYASSVNNETSNKPTKGVTYDELKAAAGNVLGTESQGSYTVKKGDTLWGIAKKVYGKGSDWRKILSANPKALSIPGNTKTLKIGTVLVIPNK
jgi:nucleoid-associated protein YgaU